MWRRCWIGCFSPRRQATAPAKWRSMTPGVEATVVQFVEFVRDYRNRLVPIHPKIKPLVKRLREAAVDGYLVPSTAEGKYGIRSNPLSKRFGHLKTALKFGKGHVFHSIRKTVATQFEQAGVAEGVAADVLGHDKKTLSYGLYSAANCMHIQA